MDKSRPENYLSEKVVLVVTKGYLPPQSSQIGISDSTEVEEERKRRRRRK